MGNMDRQRDFLIHARPQQYMRNALFLNTGTGRFQEIAAMAGCTSTDWTWSVLFGDLDNDGFQDIHVTNGISRFDMDPDLEIKVQELYRQKRYDEMVRAIQDVPGVPETHLALRNTGALKFEKTGAAWGLDHVGISQGASLADLDRDGDLDVAVAGRLAGTVSWFENDGTPEGADWTQHAVATPLGAPESVAAADLDHDGDLDLLVSLAGGDASLWYENDGGGGGWTLHTIATGLDNLLTSRAADVDADGDLDVATATLVSDDVSWFLNDGSGGGWTRLVVATGLDGAVAAIPADIDRDGDLDLFTGFRLSGGGVGWVENRGTKVHDDGFDSGDETICWSSAVP
jgi:hypothetical protein